MSPISFRLKALREEAGLSQADLANLAGIRQATVSDLESGKSRRLLDVIDKLCRTLSEELGRDVQPGELLQREPPKRKRR